MTSPRQVLALHHDGMVFVGVRPDELTEQLHTLEAGNLSLIMAKEEMERKLREMTEHLGMVQFQLEQTERVSQERAEWILVLERENEYLDQIVKNTPKTAGNAGTMQVLGEFGASKHLRPSFGPMTLAPTATEPLAGQATQTAPRTTQAVVEEVEGSSSAVTAGNQVPATDPSTALDDKIGNDVKPVKSTSKAQKHKSVKVTKGVKVVSEEVVKAKAEHEGIKAVQLGTETKNKRAATKAAASQPAKKVKKEK